MPSTTGRPPIRSPLRAAALAITMTAAAALGGCGLMNQQDAEGGRAVTVTASGPVSLTAGDTLVVTLPSNPSTGYGWALASVPTAGVLAAQGDPTYAPDNTGGMPMPGAGGKQTFRFAALAAGTARVVLVYRRSWEADVPPANTVTLDVTVTNPGG